MISNVSPRRDITAVDKNLRGMRLVSIYHYPIDDWYLGRVLGMRFRLKIGVLTKPIRPGSPVGQDRPRWLIMSRGLPFFTSVDGFYRGVDHDEWYIDRLNHLLIELFKAKIAKIEAWRLKMVSNWWLLNFQNFEISKRSKKRSVANNECTNRLRRF